MQFKRGNKIQFVKDCKVSVMPNVPAEIIPANSKWIVEMVTPNSYGIEAIDKKVYAIVSTSDVHKCCELIKESKDKHNILHDLIQTDGSVDGEKLMEKLESQSKKDAIHPDYYKFHGYDVFDIADYFGLSFPLGNSLKYILRCQYKGHELEDCYKAIKCIERHIEIKREKEAKKSE